MGIFNGKERKNYPNRGYGHDNSSDEEDNTICLDCSGVRPVNENMPIWSVTRFQVPGVSSLVSSSNKSVRMSWMRTDIAISSSLHSWYRAGSLKTVFTMFAPCFGGLE